MELTLVILMSLVGVLQSCSLTRNPIIYTMSEILDKAPIVVYGKDIYHDDESNMVTFEVYCVYKSGGADIKNTIKIAEMVNPHTCLGSNLDLGLEYVVGLEREDRLGENEYATYEPDIAHNNATFPASHYVFNITANLCDMPDPKVPAQGNFSVDACPKRNLFGDDCLGPTSNDAVLHKVSTVVALAVASVILWSRV